jgi:6-phosphogluconate dehydrogenase
VGELIHENERRPIRVGQTLFDAADELALRVPSSCRRSGRCRECVVRVAEGAESLNAPSSAEAFLPHGFRLACQGRVERADRDVRFEVLRRRLRILGAADGSEADAPLELDPVVGRQGQTATYDGEAIGPVASRLLGLAIDIGTTTVVFELVDLDTGRTIEAAAFENPQRFGGSDVMSRIAYEAANPGELRRALRRALNRELEATYRRLGVDRHEVLEAVVVGNLTMGDLFFGLDVAPLGRSPFRSITETAVREGRAASTSLLRRAHEVGLFMHPHGRVYGAPLIACHVGADIAANMAATGFAALPGVSLLVDIGTNSEMVISDGARMIAASSPTGPAFEGGGVRDGMAGADGAIESVRWDGDGFSWRIIGDVSPDGICGSGLVEVLAESVRAGLLRPDTTFAGGARTIEVAPAFGIDIDRSDVSNLAQAKAANLVGQAVLMRRLGVSADQIDRLPLAGASANALDVGNAQTIGLLAGVPPERVVRVGNASIRGARALLLSGRRRRELEATIGRIEHAELESEPDFFDLFVEACCFDLKEEDAMEIGLVGLGRMGANMSRRWQRDGHTVIGYARTAATVEGMVADGSISGGAHSLAELVDKLAKPRILWLMVPAASVDATIETLVPLLESGDILIDGGNSYYQDDIRRSRELAPRGIAYLDCGTSGGTWGLERGYCLMFGGPDDAVAYLDPIFKALAPGVERAERTPGRTGEPTTAEQGYLHCGPAGAGHFVKMVHNGIEYGIMASFAEGINILHHANAGRADREVNAETSPLAHPENYQYDIDLAAVTELWRRGSVVASWLLDLTAQAFAGNPQLAEFSGVVADSGEGRWTSIAAIESSVPAPVLTSALYSRFTSRGEANFGSKVLSAMRWGFGGHVELPRPDKGGAR